MNMFKAVPAATIEEYLEQVPQERKEDVFFLHDFIQKTVPNVKPHFAHNMIGYGSFPYKNYKKEMIEWPIIALANQKNYISIYICAIHDGKYIAEAYQHDLGKVSVGKSCIRFKKVSDIHLDALTNVLQLAIRYPGLNINQ